MWTKVFFFLIGSGFILHQVFADDVYIGELMVESNTTLEAQTILSVLNTATGLTVNTSNVDLTHKELVAECLIIGHETSCNCSHGYIWSNDVCYNHSCCREITCKKNVSHIIPLCVAKVKVYINGSVELKSDKWTSATTSELKTAFEKLNGFVYLNVTQRPSGEIADFEVEVSVKFSNSKLLEIINGLQSKLTADVAVDTKGMVGIEAPEGTVCYESSPVFKCTFEEGSDRAIWTMTNKFESFELNTGTVVKLENDCATEKSKSCSKVTLNKVTEIWEGTYTCGFKVGSILHTSKTKLHVAVLPDVITLKINPLTADCSQSQSQTGSVNITVTATILNSSESFDVSWSYKENMKGPLSNKSDGENSLVYTFTVPISCEKTKDGQNVSITFKNSVNQSRSHSVAVPVIYEGAKFCPEEMVNGEVWPNTPAGDTVINQTCPEGRIGYKSRTCEGSKWKAVFSSCVKQELNKLLNAADNFQKGLGATTEGAKSIFEGLKNSSAHESDSSEATADITASIDVFDVMSSASNTISMPEDIISDVGDVANSMLNNTWQGVNRSTEEKMSSKFLESVEGLVKNTKINNSEGISRPNIEFRFCRNGSGCNMSVYNIGVNLNNTSGTTKTVGLKKLMNRLKNNFGGTNSHELIVSVTTKSNSSLSIEMDFNIENDKKPRCVFWNTTGDEFSDEGCNLVTSIDNKTVCKCNHLTSFSVLFSKGDVSTDVLDMITNVGLGVSICSLLIFLVVESVVWSAVVKSNLSHFRHTALVNIATFLLLADCCFLASVTPVDDTLCLVLTVCKHLFYLGMFSWMLCMSVMLVHQLIFVFSPLRKRVFMFLSSIMGYVCPILIVGCSYVYCKYTSKRYHDEKTCWLVYERLLEGSIHAFILPVGTVILTNLFSMVVVILTLVKAPSTDSSKADDKDTARSILKVVVFLTPVFGITWMIGFALLMLDNNTIMHTIANYSFTILNSFQGFLILVTGCFAEQKVRDELIKLIMAKSKGKSESMTNLTSNTYTKDK